MKDWLNKRRDAAIDAIVAYFVPRAILVIGLLGGWALTRVEPWLAFLTVAVVGIAGIGFVVANEKKIQLATL